MAGFVGGKNGACVYQRIISLIPPHDVYIEPFVGAGAVLRHKRPARRSVAIDMAPGTIDALVDRVPRSIKNLEVIVGCGVAFLRHMSFSSRLAVFVYADPPYVKSSRVDPLRDYYEHEWSDEDHATFLEVADRLACPVMISGYESELYTSRLQRPKWRSCRFEAQTRGGRATEWLWMNYPIPHRLHDYRYIGQDYPERWRIHKRQRSWVKMLRKMPELERRAMLAAVIDAYSGEVLDYICSYGAGDIAAVGPGMGAEHDLG